MALAGAGLIMEPPRPFARAVATVGPQDIADQVGELMRDRTLTAAQVAAEVDRRFPDVAAELVARALSQPARRLNRAQRRAMERRGAR